MAARTLMRQEHRAGEKLFVDYAGQTELVIDRQTGEIRQAQIFVAVLGASSYTFAEAPGRINCLTDSARTLDASLFSVGDRKFSCRTICASVRARHQPQISDLATG